MKKIKAPKPKADPKGVSGGKLFSTLAAELEVTHETKQYVTLRFMGIDLGKHRGGFTK